MDDRSLSSQIRDQPLCGWPVDYRLVALWERPVETSDVISGKLKLERGEGLSQIRVPYALNGFGHIPNERSEDVKEPHEEALGLWPYRDVHALAEHEAEARGHVLKLKCLYLEYGRARVLLGTLLLWFLGRYRFSLGFKESALLDEP